MSVVFLDTETTGLQAGYHQIWEVGVVFPEGDAYEWQLPVDLERLDPTAARINGFHERYDTSNLTPPIDLAESLTKLLRRRGPKPHLVGAVISFDEERLRRLWHELGLVSVPWHYHLIDVEALVAGKLAIPPPWDSSELSRAVGVEPDDFDRHCALGDADWAKAIYEAVMS